MNSWIKKLCGDNLNYDEMNAQAAKIKPGSDGLFILPFGNGAERMLQNKMVGFSHLILILINIQKHIFSGQCRKGLLFHSGMDWI